MRVILGAGEQAYSGWISTQREQLDLRKRASFERFFGAQRATCLLCEHVWEHLTAAEGLAAARLCFDYLEPGGWLRIAVPDGHFPDATYQDTVKIGGPGPADHPAADHKIVYTIETLGATLHAAGFDVDPLEYCDATGRFHYNAWDYHSGPIYRSLRSDQRNRDFKLGFVSLIVDAHVRTNKAAA
jgi:predicted SAM-dependent methyltransferase